MSESVLARLVSADCIMQINQWIAKYPAEQQQSAVMSALTLVQDELGYLAADTLDAVADYLHMPRVAVYEVAAFYTMYERQPIGRHLISVCTNISCKLRQSDHIMAALKEKLQVAEGETTSDGRFTLRAVECLGACVNAPMMQINKAYHEQLTVDTLDAVLDQYQ
jgi:NADH-quinone oxidoreductase subunit E